MDHRLLFPEDRFYFFPYAWLADVKDAGDLDTRDLLLAHTYDGEVVFPTEQGERVWHQTDERQRLRSLFTRQTYAGYKKRLLAGVLPAQLRPYPLPPRPKGRSERLHRTMHQDMKYEVVDWSAFTTGFYRPRTYLTQRWPVWLGNSDLGSRAVLCAFMARLTAFVHQTQKLPTQITCSWQAIRKFVATHFADPAALDTEHPVCAKLGKGVQELARLGLIEEEAGPTLQYTLHLERLAGPPVWSRSAVARACELDEPRDAAWLPLLADLMTICCEPVTRLATVWEALRRLRTSPYIMDALDVNALHRYIRQQRKQGPLLRHEQVLEGFKRWCEAHQRRLCGAEFVLSTTQTALIRETIAGKPILMPVQSVRGVDATQLWIQCERHDGLTVAEAQAVLRQTHLVVWQVGETLVVVPLCCLPPKPLSIDYGYIVRANALHRQLDYSRPFEVMVKCDAPDKRLTLRCCFRVLLGKG